MKKKTSIKASGAAEPVVEYDFSKGVRGKHLERYRAARVTVQLDPDVAQEFPDSASANDALRALLRLRRGESTT
ncbi:MAG: hypothetical protein Q8O42_22105 [Acidobacteriota bacterium]|nr:hypothetical protein [Acidobacteriota bacterium]